MKAMNFEKRLKMRMVLSLSLAIIACLILVALFIWQDKIPIIERLFSSYAGIAGGMMGTSIGMFLQARAYKKDPEKRKKREREETDERNIFIQRQVFTISTYVYGGLLYIGMLIAGFFSTTVYLTLLTLLSVQLLLICILHFYLRKTY